MQAVKYFKATSWGQAAKAIKADPTLTPLPADPTSSVG